MADGEVTKEPLNWRYANHNRIEQGDYSELDRPPTLAGNPRDVAHNISRFRRANRLRQDADTLKAAARVAQFHGSVALDNANTRLADSLIQEADKIFKPAQDVVLSPQHKDVL